MCVDRTPGRCRNNSVRPLYVSHSQIFNLNAEPRVFCLPFFLFSCCHLFTSRGGFLSSCISSPSGGFQYLSVLQFSPSQIGMRDLAFFVCFFLIVLPKYVSNTNSVNPGVPVICICQYIGIWYSLCNFVWASSRLETAHSFFSLKWGPLMEASFGGTFRFFYFIIFLTAA